MADLPFANNALLGSLFSWLKPEADYPTKVGGRYTPSIKIGTSESPTPQTTTNPSITNYSPIPVEIRQLMDIPNTNTPIPDYSTPSTVKDLGEDISFLEALKSVENSVQAGRDTDGFWYPHSSPEGGLDTLGYGHKLTPTEEKSRLIELSNGKTLDFSDGLSDAEITELFYDDVVKNREKAKAQWNSNNEDIPFEELPRSHQHLLTNLVFNTGSLVKRGKFQWPKLAKALKENDLEGIRREMVTTYVDASGKVKKLQKRANTLAKALGYLNNEESSG